MKKIFFVFLLSLFFTNGFSQLFNNDLNLSSFWDFYAQNKLSVVNAGRGYAGVASENDLSGVFLNPASIEIPNKIQGVLNYDFKSSVKWSFIAEYLKPSFPSAFAGFGYRVNKNFTLGLLYYNDYNIKFDYGNSITVNEEDYSVKYTTQNISLPAVFSIKNFKLGFNLNAKYYKETGTYYEMLNPAEMSASFWKIVPSVGIVYSPVPEFSFGASYSMPYQQKVTLKITNHPDIEYPDPNYFPANVKAGIEVKLLNKNLLLDLDYAFANTSRDTRLRDRHDIHLGAQYSVNNYLTLRSGFFTARDYRKGDSYSEPYGLYNLYFLTFGATVKVKYFDINMSYMDSYLINTRTNSHTRFALGITYNCGCPY